jgi:anti-sigma B factor antagonist
MSITVHFRGPIAHIVLSGAVDYSLQDELQAANKKVLAADNIREIHVDCAEVTFMDSSGIRALFVLQKSADEMGRSLILINCNHTLRGIFEIGGFNKMFTIR